MIPPIWCPSVHTRCHAGQSSLFFILNPDSDDTGYCTENCSFKMISQGLYADSNYVSVCCTIGITERPRRKLFALILVPSYHREILTTSWVIIVLNVLILKDWTWEREVDILGAFRVVPLKAPHLLSSPCWLIRLLQN